jgi:potassium voltage-gated channel Eag-related subfamily H protein 8
MANFDFEKTSLIADYLEKSFNPNPVENDHFNKQVEEFNQKPLYTAPINKKYISPSEIKQEVKKLKTKKSAGYDFISNTFLKELNNSSIAGITAIFNAAFRIGYFPNDWKIAKVLPFRKPGKNPKDPANYRPRSLLPSLSKLLEILILKRLKKFMTNTHESQTRNLDFDLTSPQHIKYYGLPNI